MLHLSKARIVLKTSSLDVAAIRKDFPILNRKVQGKPLVYLDNAATSQKPEQVVQAIESYYRGYNANVHRGIHDLSEEATAAYEGAREKIRLFINSKRREENIFVRNATEGINLVANTWGKQNVSKGDHILLTIMEHHSNIVPWQLLAKENGATLQFVDVDNEGKLRLDQAEEMIDEGPRLLCITQMSNVLGTINPVKELTARAHDHGTTVLIDGAQSVPHIPVDLQDLDSDFFVFSGHKMMGPTGVGVVHGKRELLEEMPPFLGGGDMIKEVHMTESRWNDLPWKFEAGTPNIGGVIGLAAAVDYLSSLGMKNVCVLEKELTKYAMEMLIGIPGVHIYGPRGPEDRCGIIAFNIDGIHAHDVSTLLNQDGVAIRAGHHCAMPLMERLKIPASGRASFYIYNTHEEIDILVKSIMNAKRVFGS
uniref:cysteine desulfurase n=1 Tax=uncultured marine thaumarchaeote KM3_72_A09 TaxID=1456261 RepID=A0A075HL48_9ARCH|nr:cysteine desulfurase, SufS subfamily (sufS) [uncultured marine thaumarchaeote KM3_72_A09]